jgi:hypothetical protein
MHHMKTTDASRRGSVERGPTANRGLQFSDAPLDELRDKLQKANLRLRHLDSLRRALVTRKSGGVGIRELSREELGRLRREVFELQTDLRAELRRRGEL